MDRPKGSNADEWCLFISEHPNAHGFLAVHICEAIEQACEARVDAMGWPEINAFQDELRRGQGVREDAGGFMLRAIKRLFGLSPTDSVETYQEATRRLLAEAQEQGAAHDT